MVRDKYKDEIEKESGGAFSGIGAHGALESTKLIPINRPKINLKAFDSTVSSP